MITLNDHSSIRNLTKSLLSPRKSVHSHDHFNKWHNSEQKLHTFIVINFRTFSIFQICFFAGGWIFFVKQLFRDYEVRHVSVQLIFSSTFALSLTMFELIIFEIIGFLESSSRYFHWRLELTLLLFMVIALIPFYIAYSSISNICFGMMIFLNINWYLFFILISWFIQFWISFSSRFCDQSVNLLIVSIIFVDNSTTKMDYSIDFNRLVFVFVRILADRWSVSIAECFTWSFHHWTGKLSLN